MLVRRGIEAQKYLVPFMMGAAYGSLMESDTFPNT
jgi:hypothetical protein